MISRFVIFIFLKNSKRFGCSKMSPPVNLKVSILFSFAMAIMLSKCFSERKVGLSLLL